MTSGRWSRMVSFVIPIAVGATLFTGTPVCAQGLGGAGTVQGTVKDPTGGVMVAVTVDHQQPGDGFQAQHHDRRRWESSCSAIWRQTPITSR